MIWEYARRRTTIILMVYSSPKGHLWLFRFVDHSSLKHSVTHSSLSWISWTLVKTPGAKMPMSNSNNSSPCPALTLLMIYRFNPTRWLDSTKKYKTSPQFLAFLGGPHRCIARAMAIMQLKIVVSYVDFRLYKSQFLNIFLIDHSLQTLNSSQHIRANMLKETSSVCAFAHY